MDFITLDKLAEEEILEAMNDAFSEYEVPINLTISEFRRANISRGISYDLSIGAVENGKLIGFVLNCIDVWNNMPTAYDGGTGIIKAFQNQGVGSKLFKECIKLLKTHGIKQILLEVIKTNENAFQMYRKQNFQIIREFDCVRVSRQNWKTPEMKEEKFSDIIFKIDKNVKEFNWNQAKMLWDYPPSWQNSIETIKRMPSLFQLVNVFYNEHLIGYGIINIENGSIIHISVHKKFRKRGIGTKIMQMMKELCPKAETFSVVNIDERNESLSKFFKKFGFESLVEQYEMNLLL